MLFCCCNNRTISAFCQQPESAELIVRAAEISCLLGSSDSFSFNTTQLVLSFDSRNLILEESSPLISFCTIKRTMCWNGNKKNLWEKNLADAAERRGFQATGSFHSSCLCVLATGCNIKLLLGNCKRLHCNKYCNLLSPSVQEAGQLPVL